MLKSSGLQDAHSDTGVLIYGDMVVMETLLQGNPINLWLVTFCGFLFSPSVFVTGPRRTRCVSLVNVPLTALCFFLKWNLQVSPDFPQVCPGRHSYYRIRLHETLHHVAWQGRAASTSASSVGLVRCGYNRFLLLGDDVFMYLTSTMLQISLK